MDYVPTEPLTQLLRRLSRQELTERLHAVRALGRVRGLRYIDERNQPRTIEQAAVPWLLAPGQLAYFRGVARLLIGALVKLPSLYAALPGVRRILTMDPEQESWLRLASHPKSRPLALMGRLDSTATYSHARWRTGFEMLEPNTVGVGGVHYAPAACSVMLDALGDLLERAYPGRRIQPTTDPRDLLLEELRGVSARLGRRLRSVALIENTDYTTGTDEFAHLAEDLRRRGLEAVVADPRELRLVRGQLTARGRRIDALYRDCELGEFLEMERGGARLTALRRAIQDGRLVSGLLWEFDHKSAWELLTDPAYARLFSPAQRRLFQAHVPWTRLVRPLRTDDPSGRRVDLIAYIRAHQSSLVLKPNTLYGGQGVMVGRVVTRAEWERTLSRALRGRTPYVVQRLAAIHAHDFPLLERGRPAWGSRRVVSGFFVNSRDVGLVGRFSTDPVVNVSRGGGLLSALVIQ